MPVGSVCCADEFYFVSARRQDYKAFPGLRYAEVSALHDTRPHMVAGKALQEISKQSSALERHESGDVLHRHHIRLDLPYNLAEMAE